MPGGTAGCDDKTIRQGILWGYIDFLDIDCFEILQRAEDKLQELV